MKQLYSWALRVAHARSLLYSLRCMALLSALSLASCATVTTDAATAVTATAATLGGTAMAVSTDVITERGVRYNTTGTSANMPSGNGGTANVLTVSAGTGAVVKIVGSGNGPFSQVLSGLAPGTLYYVQAYAVATDNTGLNARNNYGSIVTFTTAALPVTAAPVVSVPANGGSTNSTVPAYSGTAVANATVTVYVDGTALPSTTTANGAGTWTLAQPTALAPGSHTVRATAQGSGSAVSTNSNTNTFTVDTVQPTVAITSTAGASGSTTTTSPIPFTVTFSEVVTGFVAGDVTVTNGSITGGTVNGSGTTYTFTVTPTTAGTATTVNVPAAVAQDGAGNANTAAPAAYSITYGTPTTLTCVTPNNALNFDGTNDYVRGTAPLPAMTAMTLEGWVYQETNSSLRTLLNGDDFPGGAVHIHMNNGTMQFSVAGSNPSDYFASTGVALNTWAHVAVVYTSTGGAGGTVKFYLNGAPLNTISATSTAAIASQNYSVGAWFSGSAQRFFDGSLNELRVWNVARTDAQIAANYQAQLSAQTGLIACYSFNQGTANGTNTTQTTLADASGSGRTGTLTGFALTAGTQSNYVTGNDLNQALAITSFAPTSGVVGQTITLTGTGFTGATAVSFNGTAAPAFTVVNSTTITATAPVGATSGTLRVSTACGTVANATVFTVCAAPVAIAQNASVTLSASGTATLAATAVNNGSNANCGPAAASALSVSPNSFSCTDAVPATVTSALSLNGVNQYISLPTTATVPVGNSQYTIEAWIKPTAMGNYGIIGWGEYGTTNQVNALRLSGTGIINYWWGPDLLVNTPSLVGAWHHVAATFNGTTRTIYLDGVAVGSDTPGSHTVPDARNLRIGVTNTNGPSRAEEYFPGSIDEVRVWNVGRTAAQINAAKGVGMPGTTPGLVAYYRLNEGSGAVANDATGNAANRGTLTNGPSWNPTDAAPVVNGVPVTLAVTDAGGTTATAPAVVTVLDNTAPTVVTRNVTISLGATGTANITAAQVTNSSSDNCGIVSLTVSPSSFTCANVSPSTGAANRYALNFDGTDDRVDLGSNVLTGGSYTKEAWVLARNNSCRNILSATNQHQFWVPNALSAGHQTTYSVVTDPSGNFPLNAWVHVAVSYDAAAATMLLYRNGVLVATSTTAPTYAAGILSIGAHGTGGGCIWDGQIDEVRIWNTVRTAAEILSSKDVTLTGAEAGLQAYYTFENGPNSATLTDVTGHGYTGTLTNMSTATAWVASTAPVAGGSLVTVTATDAAGNTSQSTATVTVTVPVTPTTTWNGTASTAWTDCANWSFGKVPDAATNAVVPAGAPRYPVLTTGTSPVQSLTIDPNGSLTLNGGATLQVNGNYANNGTATLSGTVAFVGSAATQTLGGSTGSGFNTVTVNKTAGTVQLAQNLTINSALTLTAGTLTTTGSYQVNLGGSASINELETSYVIGKAAVNRLLAAGTAEPFAGLGLTLTPAAGSTAPGATLVTRVTGTVLTGVGTSVSILRYFDIQPTVKTGLNVAMTFAYFDHELNNIAPINLALFKSVSSLAGPWANQGPLTAAANTVSKAGITDFSIWTLGSKANPLPVELTAFTATLVNPAAVRLAWATATEKNSDRFEIERSLDGKTFAFLGTVAAAGTSSAPRSYELLDAQLPAVTTLYYRLKQVDRDGTFAYSPVRSVALGEKAPAAGLTLYPNPAYHGTATLTGAVPGTVVTVYDALGRLVTSTPADASGTAALLLPAGTATGMYVVRTGSQALRLTVE